VKALFKWNDRYSEASLLYKEPLGRIRFDGIGPCQPRVGTGHHLIGHLLFPGLAAHAQTEDAVRVPCFPVRQVSGYHEQLPELLLNSHAREKIADPLIDREIGALIRQEGIRGGCGE
jgi:hypothetical protein